MTPFIIALAIACLAFSRAALRILASLAIFLMVSGAVMIIQDMHHIR